MALWRNRPSSVAAKPPPTVNANWGGLACYWDLANDLAGGIPGDDAAAFVAMVIPGQLVRRPLGNGMSHLVVGKVFTVRTPNVNAVFNAEVVPGHDGTIDTHGSRSVYPVTDSKRGTGSRFECPLECVGLNQIPAYRELREGDGGLEMTSLD